MGTFVCDAVGDLCENIVGDFCPIGSHKVVGCDGTDCNEIVIRSMVAHNTDGADSGEHAEELCKVFLVAVLTHFVTKHPIGFLQNLNLFGSYFADNSNAQARSGKRLTPY